MTCFTDHQLLLTMQHVTFSLERCSNIAMKWKTLIKKRQYAYTNQLVIRVLVVLFKYILSKTYYISLTIILLVWTSICVVWLQLFPELDLLFSCEKAILFRSIKLRLMLISDILSEISQELQDMAPLQMKSCLLHCLLKPEINVF